MRNVEMFELSSHYLTTETVKLKRKCNNVIYQLISSHKTVETIKVKHQTFLRSRSEKLTESLKTEKQDICYAIRKKYILIKCWSNASQPSKVGYIFKTPLFFICNCK